MERQRSFSHQLLKPKSLLLLSFASSSLLFSFLFSLFALRIGPLRFPFAALGANFSAKAGNVSGSHSAAEVKQVVLGGGNVEGNSSLAKDPILEGTHLAEAGNFAVEVKEVVLGGANGSNLVKDSILVTPHLAEGSNFSKGALDSAMETHLEVGNASSVEKLEETKFAEADNFSMQASDSTMEVKGAILQGALVRESGNPFRERAATEPMEQWKSSDLSTANNISESTPIHPEQERIAKTAQSGTSVQETVVNKTPQCDVYDGRWVFDESYPLYASNSCPFIDEGFGCEANGRKDRDFMKWRWQPQHCNIPRFNAREMLDMLGGKRLVFVGDSINRNQWESMMCLLREAVSDPTRIREARGRRITKERGDYSFKFLDCNCSVEYHVTHFLVHESKARIGQKRTKTLRIDTVDRSSSRWRGADVLVFNTAHWWSHHKTKAGANYYQEGDHVHPRLDASTAFRKALTTWALWVDQHVDPRKTRVFFRSSAPSHFSGGEWNSGGHCKESTLPLADIHARPVPERNMILEQVVKQMKTPVTVLNITNLSGVRIDGHPSVYGRKPGEGTPSSNIQDCSHWCLPGVPDSWNELLFYHLISAQKNFRTGSC